MVHKIQGPVACLDLSGIWDFSIYNPFLRFVAVADVEIFASNQRLRDTQSTQ
jgi:hypothetical protein